MTATVNMLPEAAERVRFAAGETIFSTNETGELMYIVLSGEVHVWYAGRLLSNVGPQGIFGEMALIDKRPRSATAIAHTDVELAAVDQRRFLFLVHETPLFAIQVMRVMSERMRVMLGRD
jgi:CRP/FNR family transcriptional regulator, cyclic AMP receptor protein